MPQLTNALSIDVEDWFHVEAFATLIPPNSWPSHTLRVEKNVDCILEVLQQTKTQATFFTLGWVAERLPDVVKRIAAEGHEIGSHGWSHAPLWRLTPEQFRDEVVRSRGLLEELSGQRVKGYRAPTFSITAKTLWGLRILAESGYHYDSSIFPVHHDRYGIPDAPLTIHRRDEGIWEVPMSVYEMGTMRVPVAGGGYFRLYPEMFTWRAIRKINAAGRPAIVYLHPWEFDPGQPQPPGVKLLSRLRHYVGISKTRDKLKRMVEEFPFGSMSDVLSQQGIPPQ